MARPYYVYGGNLLNREKYTSVVNTAYGERRYFSSIDTDVYFGDLLIDEMVAFDFVIEEKKIPIFGYNNFVPKRIITGQKVIQGSFAINFTRSYDMHYILENVADSLYANDYEEAQFYCSDDNAAIFGKGFDITISYGEDKETQSYNSCTQTLVGCYITSYRQAFDTSGEPILDMYTFIAKDLIVQMSEAIEEEVSDVGDTKSETWNDKESASVSKSEPYKVANNAIQKETDELYNYCNEHPDTLGIFIHPQYAYKEGKSTIELYVCSCQHFNNLKVNSATITITDIALPGSYSFKLTKVKEKFYHYTELTGTNVNVGKKMAKLFSDGTVTELECTVYMDVNDGKENHSIEYPTVLTSGGISNY